MTNDAPHSAPTPLSRFLGGWMRHSSPQEPEQVPDDAGAAEAAGIGRSAKPVGAAESAARHNAATGPVARHDAAPGPGGA